MITDTVLMVRPVHFQFNPETAQDNEFMNKPSGDAQSQIDAALKEYDAAVLQLEAEGLEVISFDLSRHEKEFGGTVLPDAVFPNNWFSTDAEGGVTLYPMYAKSRNLEKMQFRFVAEELLQRGFEIARVRNFEFEGRVLEGTGSIVIDHRLRRAYCALSQRSELPIFERWCELQKLEPVSFDAFSSKQVRFYHTNVMLSIGDSYAVVCRDSIPQDQRERVLSRLAEDREIIDISPEQAEKHFCGNTIQLRGKTGNKLIVMSHAAHDGFSQQQREQLAKHGKLLAIDIPTIELIGGGSARCMVAEVFLPRR